MIKLKYIMILHIVHHYIPYNKINPKNHKQYIFQKKSKKPSIFGHFGPKRPILDSFWPKIGKTEIKKNKKTLEKFFLRLQSLTNCKVSEKS